MKTIAVSNGDIQLNNGKIQFAVGSNKLAQDLTRWFQEPLGTGFTTPNFGSLLPGMVGGNQNTTTVSAVTNEITRVLQLYQGQQIISLKNAQNSAMLSNWNKSEIIQNINSVKASLQYASIVVEVSITTLNNNNIQLLLSINNSGVTVQNG